jgi:hypothetical protein
MKNSASVFAWMALSTAVALSMPSSALAQPSAAARQEAGRHFRAGVAAYQSGDYSTALGEFQSAYRIAPHHSVRVNMANCFMHLGRPIDAINHFESFLSEAASAGGVQPTQRREVEAQLVELRAQIAEVQVRIEPATARDPIITVDGQPATAAGVLRMMPGRHTIEVTADGFATARQDFNASAGQRAEVSITLRAPVAAVSSTSTGATATSSATTSAGGTGAGSAGASVASNAQPTAGGSSSDTSSATSLGPAASGSAGGAVGDDGSAAGAGTSLVVGQGPTDTARRGLPLPVFIAAAGATGAAAITWGVMGGLALGANSEFDTIARRIGAGAEQPDDVARGEAAARRARTFALVSDVMMGVTVAGAVATTVIAISTRWKNPAATTVAFSPTFNASGAGVSIGGSF